MDYFKIRWNRFKQGGFKAIYKTMAGLLDKAKSVSTLMPEFKAACDELVRATNDGVFEMRVRAKKKDRLESNL